MPAVACLGVERRPDDEVRQAGTDLLVASGAAIGLRGPERRHAADDVLLAAPVVAALSHRRQRTLGRGGSIDTSTILARHDANPRLDEPRTIRTAVQL